MEEFDPKAIRAKERRATRDAVQAFLEAVAAGDLSALAGARNALNEAETGAWRKALLRCRSLTEASEAARQALLTVWLLDGPEIRDEASSDLALIDALRAVLPKWSGGPLTLFRGENAWCRRRRRYGLSWTTNVEVAESYAEERRRWCRNGCVLLRSMVPADAIICAVSEHDARSDEAEYLVDRRRLGIVSVERRFRNPSP